MIVFTFARCNPIAYSKKAFLKYPFIFIHTAMKYPVLIFNQAKQFNSQQIMFWLKSYKGLTKCIDRIIIIHQQHIEIHYEF